MSLRPRIRLCFLWHMHQPFYKDLISGEYKLPWTRLHALKDYYGMVAILRDFPEIRQTFNLVPSLMVQVEEYAAGAAADPFQRCALKPAEELTEAEHAFALHYFFQANVGRMIRRYPRYSELYDAWLAADRNPRRARHYFGAQATRDLQVLSQLAWFDEEFQAGDEEVRALIERGAGYTLADQALMGRKQIEILSRVLPVYQEFTARGQIEVSTTPFYHPILPLLCDSSIAATSHPYVPLPSRFQYPGDALHQMEKARAYHHRLFGAWPDGMWPSEGSVSDEVLGLAAGLGFRWIATDNGVLTRTLNQLADVDLTYRPYLWRREGRSIKVVFRDHYLSDLIGFVYARMGAAEAAVHFLDRIRENCQPILDAGREALVPVILDGENAWEYYEQGARPFFRELYARISADPEIEATTISEALDRIAPQAIDHIFPGSWINANFDIWIGAEEDNRAWEYLLCARQTFDRALEGPGAASISEANRQLAFEELLIAEGSDWCWWYGPEHFSTNRAEFDHLFRTHLANVYRALGLAPPDELSRPIVKLEAPAMHEPPSAPIRPSIDGEVTSYFEWLGAGLYRIDGRSGSMHGQRFLIRELHYGSDGRVMYFRLDFLDASPADLDGLEARLNVQSETIVVCLADGRVHSVESPAGVEAAFRTVLEMSVPLAALRVVPGEPVRVQLSLWRSGLPVDALPYDGWLEIPTAEPRDWPA
jgi:alpha-amylase/alpha-mannosidase (GH57 family)